jgi:uncharacterized membrane protein
MQTRLSVAGNPIYPMLFMVPLGLLVTATLFDLADLGGGPALLGLVGYWHIVAGVIGGVCALVVGLVDLAGTRPGSAARRTAVTYALVSLGVLMLFTVVLMVRMREEHRGASWGLYAVELLALAGGACACRFGNELYDRFVAGGRLTGLAQRALGGARLPYRVGTHRS